MFDPFNDRKARKVRNALSVQFVQAIESGDGHCLRQLWGKRALDGMYRQYVEDRLQRYDLALAEIEGKNLVDCLEKFCVLWNNKLYFECHELLEKEWMPATGTYRKTLQGLIQAAGYFIHRERNAPSAAEKIGARAMRNIGENRKCFPHWFDVDRICHCINNNDITAPQLRLPRKDKI